MCTAAQLVVEVRTDRAAYRPGDLVGGVSTLRNRSASTCFYGSYSATIGFLGPSGEPVGLTSNLHADALPGTLTALPSGGALSQDTVWDQRNCNGSQCLRVAPGTYALRGTWDLSGPGVTGSTTFVLLAA